jgi:hypothetical protein
MPNANSFPIKPLFGWQISEISCLPLYQTTDMQQWILHKNQCYERRSASSTARPSENERYDRRNDRRDDRLRDVDDSVIFWGWIPAAEIDFDVIALDIDVYLGPEVAPSRPSYRLPDSPPCFHYWLRLFLREYRAAALVYGSCSDSAVSAYSRSAALYEHAGICGLLAYDFTVREYVEV